MTGLFLFTGSRPPHRKFPGGDIVHIASQDPTSRGDRYGALLKQGGEGSGSTGGVGSSAWLVGEGMTSGFEHIRIPWVFATS